jgi:hypothetical protein
MADLSNEMEAYAAYLNAPRDALRFEERLLLDEDTMKAKAAMEAAWLDRTMMLSDRGTPGGPVSWDGG